jgi:benzodiazapine receptor
MSLSRRRKLLTAIVGIAVSQLAGVVGATATRDGIRDWYPALRKPWFNPPAWIFGPVWTVLYTMMGIAVSSVWRQRGNSESSGRALRLFGTQLLLNSLWSVAFFKLRSTALGMIVIVPLWLLILATTIAFFPISRVAGLLLVPYLGWTTFATVLNLKIWELNRGRSL